MQWKQPALLAKDNEDRAQEVPSHVESRSRVIGVYDDLASGGYQITCDPRNV
jgi:hypothetical protein